MQLEDLFDVHTRNDIEYYVKNEYVSNIPLYIDDSNTQLDTTKKACLIHGKDGSYIVLQTEKRLELRDTFATGRTLLSFDKGEFGWIIDIVSHYLKERSKGELHNLRKNLSMILSTY